jgi:NitT/TauT family transport system ATP-binding protein
VVGQRGTAIDIDRVTKVFEADGERPFPALTELSIHIAPGEFVSVVGPSGCGKSTLMLMTAGLLGPTSGEIRVAGRRLISPPADVGIVFQDDLLLEFRAPWTTCSCRAVRRSTCGKLAARGRAAGQLGVAHARSRYPRRLSAVAQRVSLARALVHDPRFS